MKFSRGVPIGWLNLTDNMTSLAASVAGVAFSVVLISVELGFLNGVHDSQTRILHTLNADLLIVDRHKQGVAPRRPFPLNRISQARNIAGVAGVYPVYLEEYRALWKNSTNGREYPILVFAFNPQDPAFTMPQIATQSYRLQLPDTALVDTKSKDFYGPLRDGTVGELNGRSLRIVGGFPLGPNFRVDGNLIVSDRTYFKCFHDPVGRTPEKNNVEFGLVEVAPGYNITSVQRSLLERLPKDVIVYTKFQYIGHIRRFWSDSKSVGKIFGMGAFVGFCIGIMVCYQILYTSVLDRLPQYATLKAIGYSNGFLARIVLQEATCLSLLGFFPGLALSHAGHWLLERHTGLTMNLTVSRAIPVLGVTVLMSAFAGLLAAAKAMQASPTELFNE